MTGGRVAGISLADIGGAESLAWEAIEAVPSTSAIPPRASFWLRSWLPWTLTGLFAIAALVISAYLARTRGRQRSIPLSDSPARQHERRHDVGVAGRTVCRFHGRDA